MASHGRSNDARRVVFSLVAVAGAVLIFTPVAQAQTCSSARYSWEGIPFTPCPTGSPPDCVPHNPPDTHGAAGANGVLAVVNLRISYYQRSGTANWGPVCLRPFFGLPGGCEPTRVTGSFPNFTQSYVTDPRAVYDPVGGHFYVILSEQRLVQFHPDQSSSILHIAVSKDSDPSTSTSAEWQLQSIDITQVIDGCALGDDYPGLGFDGQAIYVTYDPASLGAECGPSAGEKIVAIDKASLLTTTPSYHISYAGGAGTLLPVNVLGTQSPGNKAYFIDADGSSRVRLWALTDPLGATPTLDSSGVILPRFGSSGDATEPSPCHPLNTRAGIPQGNGFWHDGSLRFCITGGPMGGPSKVYYFRIATNGFPAAAPSLLEADSLGGADWFYQPAIGGNANGDLGMVFSRSSPDSNPSIWFTTRKAGSTSFRPIARLKSSASCYSSSATSERWGDYATVSADPADQSLWMAHEWVKGSAAQQWGTWWGNTEVFAPTIMDLAVAGRGKTTMVLQWSEPYGNPCSYDLRYSNGPIDEYNFAGAARALPPPAVLGVPGGSVCYSLDSLVKCQTYYFAVKWSYGPDAPRGISNVPSQSTKCSGSEVLCADGFAADVDGDGTLEPGASSWLATPEPDPSSGPVVLRYGVSSALAGKTLELAVFDVAGRRLRVLERGLAFEGMHRTQWDLTTGDGPRLGPGTYFLRLTIGDWHETKWLRIIR